MEGDQRLNKLPVPCDLPETFLNGSMGSRIPGQAVSTEACNAATVQLPSA